MNNVFIGCLIAIVAIAVVTLPVTASKVFDVQACNKYGETFELENKQIGRKCYVKRQGVWIDQFDNDSIESRKFDKF